MFHVGDFDNGDVKLYSPAKNLESFNILEAGNVFPKICTMVVCLMEHDHGSLSKWYDKLLDEVGKYVTEKLLALGFVVGSSLGPLGAVVGAAIGEAVGIVQDGEPAPGPRPAPL